MSYNEISKEIENVKSTIADFKGSLDIYKASRGNSGYDKVAPKNLDTTLTDFDNYFKNDDIVKLDTNSYSIENGSRFDYPMYCKLYGNDGELSYGITPDIGFAKNVSKSESFHTNLENLKNIGAVLPTGANYRNLAYNPDSAIYMATPVPDYYNPVPTNTFIYSHDGIHWTSFSINIEPKVWESLSYVRGFGFVAIARGKVLKECIFASRSGFRWSALISEDASASGEAIPKADWIKVLDNRIYGSHFKVYEDPNDSDYGVVLFLNGPSYTKVTKIQKIVGIGENGAIYDIIKGRDKYVATRGSEVYVSTDGVIWEKSNVELRGNTGKLYYYNGIYFICSTSNSLYPSRIPLYYSMDGNTWNEVLDSINGFCDMAYENGIYLLADYNFQSPSFTYRYSTDAINWKSVTVPLTSNNNEYCLNASLINRKAVVLMSKSIIANEPIKELLYTPNSKYYEYQLSDKKEYLMHVARGATTTSGGTLYYKLSNSGTIKLYPNEINPSNDLNAMEMYYAPFNADLEIYPITPIRDTYMRKLFAFITTDKPTSSVKRKHPVTLHITTDFIKWNTHILIPLEAFGSEPDYQYGEFVKKIISAHGDIATREGLEHFVRSCFQVLPNNQYIIFPSYQKYMMGDSDNDKDKMAIIYSPYSSNPIMEINDPYDYPNNNKKKAIHGISAYLDEDGQYVMYYNNFIYPPLSLGFDNISNSVNLMKNGDRKNIPLVGKYYRNFPNANSPLVVDASNISGIKPSFSTAVITADSASNDYSTNNFPAAFINIEYDDDKHFLHDITSSSRFLEIGAKTEYFGNIDENLIDYTSGERPSTIWKTRTTPKENWIQLYYHNGMYIAAAYNRNPYYSTDGINWTRGINSGVGDCGLGKTIFYGRDRFVIIDYNGIYVMSSFDGIHWFTPLLKIQLPNSARPIDIKALTGAYGNNIYVVAEIGYKMYYSTDFHTWTAATPIKPPDNQSRISGICYADGKFVACGSSMTISSTDGINWDGTCTGLVDGVQWISICYGNGKFVIIPHEGTDAAYSVDGKNWTIVKISDSPFYAQDIKYSDGKFTVICSPRNRDRFFQSSDGITWHSMSITVEGTPYCSITANGRTIVGCMNYNNGGIDKMYYNEPIAPLTISDNTSISQVASMNASGADRFPKLISRMTAIGNSLNDKIKDNSPIK